MMINFRGQAQPIRFRIFLATVVILGFWVSRLPAQKSATSGQKAVDNVEKCLQSLTGCDVSSLRPDDIARISEVSRQRNLEVCRSLSSGCDPTGLPSEEQKKLKVAIQRRNLDRCLRS